MQQNIKTYRKEKQMKLNVYFVSPLTILKRDIDKLKIEGKSQDTSAKRVVRTLQMTRGFIE